MSEATRKLRWSLIVGLALALLAGSSGAIAGESTHAPAESATAIGEQLPDLPDVPPATIGAPLTEAQLYDLGVIANEEGISLSEAIERYGWHEWFSLLVDQIRQEYSDAFAGARIEDDGSPWIAFKETAPDDAVNAISSFDTLPGFSREIEIITDRGFTEEELDSELVAAHFAALGLTSVADASSAYDIATGRIRVEVETARQATDETVHDDIGRRPEFTKDHIDIVIVEEVIASDDAYAYGGKQMTYCTSGFTVYKYSTRGLATAGHCNNSQTYTPTGTSLAYYAVYMGWWGDVQWHTSISLTFQDDFYYTASYRRDVSGTAMPTEGQWLCRYGYVSGNQCDRVYQLNHCSGSICHLTAMHNDEASGGDSGGPWYSGNTAYGLHQGWKIWFGSRDVFTPVRYIDDALGIYVATS